MTIETVSEAEDLLTEVLAEFDITGVEIRDKKQILDGDTFEIYEDVMPAPPTDDGTAEVIFYLEENEDAEATLEKIRARLEELREIAEIGPAVITEDTTEEEDWVNNWKAYFHPFTVDDILIKPTWEALPEGSEGKLLLEIDPGTAFGTGSHETTKLSLRAISKYVKPGDRVLDVGTGSGILSILAVKRGAAFAFGTDIDPLAVEAAWENAGVNGVSADQLHFALGDLITDEALQAEAGDAVYDVAVANILADVIIPLQREIVRHIKPGGVFLVSGIIESKREALLRAFDENPALELLEEEHLGEWIGFALRRI